MAHTSPKSLLAPSSRLFTRLAWGGLAVAAFSMASLVLFSIYHLLAGVISIDGSAATSRVWLIGVGALAVGVISSIVGFTMGVEAKPSRSDDLRVEARPTIAA